MNKIFLLILVLPLMSFAQDSMPAGDPNGVSATSSDPNAGALAHKPGLNATAPCDMCLQRDNLLREGEQTVAPSGAPSTAPTSNPSGGTAE